MSLGGGAELECNFGERPFRHMPPDFSFRPVAESVGSCYCC
jgi:hypothetical protein